MNVKQKVNAKNVEDILVLGPMQEGMLYQYLRELDSRQYVEQFSYELSGSIDLELFRRAWQWVVDQNEMLRTVFKWEKLERPLQMVLRDQPVSIVTVDQSTCSVAERTVRLKEWQEALVQHGFDLSSGPLFQVGLCKWGALSYTMVIQNHHIIFDGWSNGILLQEFFTVYAQLVRGEVPGQVQKTRYKEYLKWLQRQEPDSQRRYWQEYLQGFGTKTRLPFDRKKTREITAADLVRVTVPDDLQRQMEALAREQKVTVGSLFYAAYGVLLQKYSHSQDVVFGTTVSGRQADLPGVERMVGLLINTLPLRIRARAGQSVRELLREVQEMVQQQQNYATTPLVVIKACSEVGSREALFDSIVVLENYPLDEAVLAESPLRVTSCTTVETTNFDLVLGILTHTGMELHFGYNPEAFQRVTVERLAGHFLTILTNIVANPDAEAATLEMISPEEVMLLQEWNATKMPFPREKTVVCDLYPQGPAGPVADSRSDPNPSRL